MPVIRPPVLTLLALIGFTRFRNLTNAVKRCVLMTIVPATLALASALGHSAPIGSFTLVGSMTQFRRDHTATLLLNGTVLVAGGAPILPATTSEIFDPFTATWTNSGSLDTGRQFHTATLLQDGRVVVTGGQTASQLLASTEVYDPPSGRWTGVGDLNQPRELHTATLLPSGLVLVAGGFANISSAELFDPTTRQWTLTGSMAGQVLAPLAPLFQPELAYTAEIKCGFRPS